MNCKEVQNGEVVERYLANQLPDAEKEAFEQHYFACDRCFAELEAARSVQQALESRAPAIRDAQQAGRSRSTYSWVALLAVAASLIIAIGIVWRTTQASLERAAVHAPATAPKSPDYTELARVTPPVYNPPNLRSSVSPDEAAFRAAMESYRAHDYAAAIAPLQAVTSAGLKDPAPHFYLAACYLLTGHAAAAVPELQSVLKLKDARFEEEAHLLLAKAWLQQNQPQPAREELQKIAGQTGDFTAEAKALLAKLDSR